MLSLLRGAASRSPLTLPLFPLNTVLFPGGLLPLKIFEQRYVAMTKECLKDDRPFGVCLLTQGSEVAQRDTGADATQFARVGTLARITSWDMPQLGILHVKTEGSTRFQVQSHSVQPDGLLVAQVTAIPAEAKAALPATFQSLATLLQRMIEHAGPEHFAGVAALDDSSWVGHRLAELLPLPLPIKQSMLEINDSLIRLKVIAQFLTQQALL
jgi:Lon protease-like protein